MRQGNHLRLDKLVIDFAQRLLNLCVGRKLPDDVY